MGRSTARVRDVVEKELIDAIVDRTRREGAVRLTALRLGKLTSRAQGELLDTLAKAGLEHTGRAIRVPLRDQLRQAVAAAGESGVLMTALARAVKGARSAAEVKLFVRELLDEGALRAVAEGRALRVALPGPRWLEESELGVLASAAQQLAGLAKAVKPKKGKPRATLARKALEGPARALQELVRASQEAPARAALQAAFRVAPRQAGLVRIPDVICALEALHGRAALLDALDALAREGALELRPESAIGRLGDADRARCPAGLDGTPLSYARPIETSEVRA